MLQGLQYGLSTGLLSTIILLPYILLVTEYTNKEWLAFIPIPLLFIAFTNTFLATNKKKSKQQKVLNIITYLLGIPIGVIGISTIMDDLFFEEALMILASSIGIGLAGIGITALLSKSKQYTKHIISTVSILSILSIAAVVIIELSDTKTKSIEETIWHAETIDELLQIDYSNLGPREIRDVYEAIAYTRKKNTEDLERFIEEANFNKQDKEIMRMTEFYTGLFCSQKNITQPYSESYFRGIQRGKCKDIINSINPQTHPDVDGWYFQITQNNPTKLPRLLAQFGEKSLREYLGDNQYCPHADDIALIQNTKMTLNKEVIQEIILDSLENCHPKTRKEISETITQKGI